MMNFKKTIYCVILVSISSQSYSQHALDTLAYLKNNPNIYSLIIYKRGRITAEKYYNSYNGQMQFSDQSLTKSICSLLIGIAINKGYIRSVDEKLAVIFPELNNDPDKRKQQITIRQVMNQASGLYHEDLAKIADFLKLPNQAGYVLNAPMAGDPGKEWHYDNAASHLLSVILTKTTGMDTRSFAQKYLFTPMGIKAFQWVKMNDGYYDGSGLLSISMRSRDMLKIGKLIVDNGRYNDKQLVPAAWIRSILQPEVVYPTDWGFENSTYGLDFYHASFKGISITYGMGWGGQFLIMIPSLQAVIVANENIADANAVKQSVAFVHQVFPVIYELITDKASKQVKN